MSALPEKMTVIAIAGKGGPEVLVPQTQPVPKPGPGQVLVKVLAAGVNRPDVLQRMGLYPAPKGHNELPGLEIAGEVAAIGAGVTRFEIGQSVMALVNGGGYAEYCLADEGTSLHVPEGLSINEAAGLPETFFTVWHNVFERGALTAGEWILIHGGTSGIGVTAIQLAKAFGAKVITTTGSDAKCEAARALGADRTVNYRTQDFLEAVKDATGGRGVDVILDMVGGSYIEKNIRALADDGRLVYIGFQSGSKAEIDFMRVMLKRLTITGSTLRIRPAEVKAHIARKVEAEILPLLASGEVKVPIDSTFPLAQAAEAHRRIEEGTHVGKIILTTG